MELTENSTDYLDDLMKDTPIGRMKLSLAWDCLSAESQIKLLHRLKHIPNEVKEKISTSKYDYIRYLGASRFYLDEKDDNDQKILTYILEDKCPLVRFTQDRHTESFSKNPRAFLSMPFEQQLFEITKFHPGWRADDILSIINEALSLHDYNSKNLDLLIEEFVKTFATQNVFKEMDFDGWMYFTFARSFQSLWQIIPKLGNTRAALLMATYLPADADGDEVSEDTLNALDKKVLKTYLNRYDVHNSDLRKKILFSSTNEYDEDVRRAAAFYNFNLDKDDFYELIHKNRQDVFSIFIKGNCYFPKLAPVYIFALKDINQTLLDHKHKRIEPIETQAVSFKNFFEKQTEHCISEEDKREVIESHLTDLATYQLAKEIVPWEKDKLVNVRVILGRDLLFLEKHIFTGDTWRTFIAFSRVLDGDDERRKIVLNKLQGRFKMLYLSDKNSEKTLLLSIQEDLKNFVNRPSGFIRKCMTFVIIAITLFFIVKAFK